MKKTIKRYDITQYALYKCQTKRRLERLLLLKPNQLKQINGKIGYHQFEIEKCRSCRFSLYVDDMTFSSSEPYDKAKQDILQAMDSIRKLPPLQQQMLAEDLVGAENVAVLLNILHQAFLR